MGRRACPSISRVASHGTSRRKNLITIPRAGLTDTNVQRERLYDEKEIGSAPRPFSLSPSLCLILSLVALFERRSTVPGEDNRGGSTRLSFEPAKSD